MVNTINPLLLTTTGILVKQTNLHGFKLTTWDNFSKNIRPAFDKSIDEMEKSLVIREEGYMRKYPRIYSKTELKKFGVTLEDERKLILRCDKCRQGWMVNLKPGGKIPRGSWRCPNRCNWPE